MTMYMLVGGIGTLLGPLLGASVPWLTQYLQFLQDYRFVVFGPLLVIAGDLPAARHRRHLAEGGAPGAPTRCARAMPEAARIRPTPATANGATPCLRSTTLTKRFGGLAAVNDVSTSSSSAGTSTPSSAPTARARPPSSTWSAAHASGRARAASCSTAGRDRPARRPGGALGIARTFQSTHLFDMATVLDNLIVGHRLRTKLGPAGRAARHRRLREEERICRDKAQEALDFVGLARGATASPGDISQEERKRVAFALALATDPELLLLDEPAGGVNPEETVGLAALIRKLVATARRLPDRTQDGHDHEPGRQDHGAELRREDRRGHARRDPRQPASSSKPTWGANMLRLENVSTLHYGSFRALSGVTLHAERRRAGGAAGRERRRQELDLPGRQRHAAPERGAASASASTSWWACRPPDRRRRAWCTAPRAASCSRQCRC
jgi:branched-chain amino acid transport system ATP-binding protein